AKAPELARERERKAAVQFRRLSSLTEQQLHSELHSIATSGDAEAMGPDKSPSEWQTAREAIRDAAS
ncbi:MAG TPA: hypothetical protein VLT15_09445, partial [Acidimicrobiia bacterium]|nr:hypothetical protein [Acidimicrobiia bacterium]